MILKRSYQALLLTMSVLLLVMSFLIPMNKASAEVINREKYEMDWAYSPQFGKEIRTELLKNASGQIAYCLVHGLKSPDGQDLPEQGRTDDIVYRILLNGYPQKSPQELGVSTWEQAHYSTQLAVWNALGQINVDELQFKDTAVKQATKAIINAANASQDTQDVWMNIVPVDKQEAKLNGEYFETTYTVQTNAQKGTFKVQLSNAPEGTRVVTEKGETKETFQLDEKVRVQVPKSSKSSELSLKVVSNLTNYHAVVYKGTDSIQDATVLLERNKEQVSADLQVYWKANGSLKVMKVDENKKPLSGATFEVFNSNNQSMGTITANEGGIAQLGNLELGTYSVKEIKAPVGYVLDSNPRSIEVKTGEVAVVEMKNEKIKGNIQIKKVDDSGKVLSGVEFTVFTQEGKEVTKVTTNEQGIAEVKGLPYNKYIFKETKGVQGYLLNDTKYPFEIKENGKVLTFTVENKQVKGNVQLLKIDQENADKKLEGTTFILQDSKGKEISEHTTDKNGLIKVNNLPFGEYQFIEKVSPKGYVLTKEPISFRITEHGKTIELVAKNKQIKGILEITKVDVANGNTKLPNAEFTIYNEQGQEVVKGKTDKNGIAKFDKLAFGKYTYKETFAPEGYLLNEETFSFEIKEDGQIIKHTVKDQKKSTPTPLEQPQKPQQEQPQKPQDIEKHPEQNEKKPESKPLPMTGGKESPYRSWIGIGVLVIAAFVMAYAFKVNRKTR
ncbi:TQXA domain-containing protein [Bacillus sp. 491mf]|uniref:thioester domain-containing protein n=1 Tax=Bacillus sp. 491mf TaxID=1761755 RepID=UPI0008E370C9|nr:thioester domain-containing protein [Bacillus sp. 491mf]SFD18325.1 TQXA domain-containing protein [Bacillus sp. 491mf]